MPKIIVILLILFIITAFAFSSFRKQNISVDNVKVDVKTETQVMPATKEETQPVKKTTEQIKEQNEVCKKNIKCTDSEGLDEPAIYKKYF
jgi:hypothetical protein